MHCYRTVTPPKLVQKLPIWIFYINYTLFGCCLQFHSRLSPPYTDIGIWVLYVFIFLYYYRKFLTDILYPFRFCYDTWFESVTFVALCFLGIFIFFSMLSTPIWLIFQFVFLCINRFRCGLYGCQKDDFL